MFERLLIAALTLTSATAFATDDWTNPFPGVRRLHRYGPANVNVNAAVVDLCAPGVSVRTTAFDERAQRTSAFATGVGAQLAMNADFSCRPIDVGPNSPFPPCIGRPAYTTYGIAAHGGAAWPDTISLDAMLAFGADRVQVFDDAENQPFQPSWMKEVISGHWSLVREGVLLPNDCPIDPRSAVGLSKDRRSLIMAVADGRNGWRGMTCLEIGQLLIDLGADRAFALDSGGSTTMWMAGQGVLNHPSDGSERVVGNHLAVFADGQSRPAFCDLPPAKVNAAAPLPALAPIGSPGRLVPLSPQRLFDTRTAQGSSALLGVTRDAAGRVAGGSAFSFQSFDAFSVPADARAVLVNLAATDVEGEGFATAWPGQLGAPNTSTVNYRPGVPSANTAFLALEGARTLSVSTSASAQLIGDLQAAFAPAGAGLLPLAPQRLLDTRAAAGLVAGVSRQIVARQAGNTRALALSIAVTGTASAGFLTLYPCDEAVPPTSNLNFGASATVAASAVVRLGPAGICALASTDTHLIVDAMGTFVDQGGLDLQPVAPVRLVDTRALGGPWEGRAGRGQSLQLDVSRAPGFPADAQAVVLNLTITGAVDDGFASLAPCSSTANGTSNINFRVGKTVANTVLVGTGGGPLCLVSSGRAHVIVDMSGVFVGHQAVVAPPLTVPPAEASAWGTASAQDPSAEPSVSLAPNLPPTTGGCAAAPGGACLAAAMVLLRARRRSS
jgi:Phosphodiester glycosidase